MRPASAYFQPGLRGILVLVLFNKDGCLIARSEAANTPGIQRGAPWHLHKKQFRRSRVVMPSNNYTLYNDMNVLGRDLGIHHRRFDGLLERVKQPFKFEAVRNQTIK